MDNSPLNATEATTRERSPKRPRISIAEAQDEIAVAHGNNNVSHQNIQADDANDAENSVTSNNAVAYDGIEPVVDASARNDNANDVEEEEALALPPEVWANVMDHLDYTSILSCSTVSKLFLHDAMPLVKVLQIEDTRQMNVVLAPRFRDCRKIIIRCLLEEIIDEDEEDDIYYEVDSDAIMRVVPFLSRFPLLERVVLGGKTSDGDYIGFLPEGEYWDDDEDPPAARMLIDMISGGFRCRILPENLKITGLRCPYASSHSDSTCKVCTRACESFHIDQVVRFDSRGSSLANNVNDFRSYRPCLLGVCLDRTEIERIVVSRPGGKELLSPLNKLLLLLGRGSRYAIHTDINEAPLYVVKFNGNEMAELRRVINGVDLNTISIQAIYDAIMTSFADGNHVSLPPKDQCYLANSSLTVLKEELKIPIREGDFLHSVLSNMRNIPQIIKAILSTESHLSDDCLHLFSHMLRVTTKPPVQQILNLGMIPKLVSILGFRMDSSVLQDALVSIGEIAGKGASEQAEFMVEQGVIDKLIRFLRPNENILGEKLALDAARCLGIFAAKSSACRDTVLTSGAVIALSEHVERAKDLHTKKVVSWSLWKCLGSGPEFSESKPCLKQLCVLILNDNLEVQRNSCKALHVCLRGDPAEVIEYIKSETFIRIMELATEATFDASDVALEMIQGLSRYDEEKTSSLVSIEDMSKLVQFTPTNCQNKTVQRVAFLALCKCIMKSSKEQIRATGFGDFNAVLIKMANHEEAAQALFTTEKVFKVCPNDLPNEMFGAKDLDPSTPEDMNTIFTPDGFFPVESNQAAGLQGTEQKYQDTIKVAHDLEKNWSQCAICNGEIGEERICCLQCPRAYDKECFDQLIAKDAEFQGRGCRHCADDLRVKPEEDIETSMVVDERIVKAFDKAEYNISSYTLSGIVLSQLLHILDKLLAYDYGFIFAYPVNLKDVGDYQNVIKRPMDYGTIVKTLEGGEYVPEPDGPSSKGEMDAMEEIVLLALKDITQVHHNCLLYNANGSVYYKCGEVMDKKWRSYFDKHIKDRLPEVVQLSLTTFQEACEKERNETTNKRHFQMQTKSNSQSRAIAVFDPDTKMIVKQYSSRTSARLAAVILAGAGYECECELTPGNVKTVLENAEDPQKPLFSYQWIPIDKLKAGRFTSKINPALRSAQALCKICTYGSTKKQIIKGLLSQGFIRPLCNFIRTGYDNIVDEALEAMKKVLMVARKQNNERGVALIVRCEIQWIKEAIEDLEQRNRVAQGRSDHLDNVKEELRRLQESLQKNRKSATTREIKQHIIIKGKAYPM